MAKGIGFSFLFLILAGCNYSQQKVLPLDAVTATSATEGLNYKTVADQILKTNCLTCHSAAKGDTAGLNLENYANVKAAAADIRSWVGGRMMPPADQPQLSDAQIKNLLAWIDAGVPEFGDGTVAPPPTQPPVTEPPAANPPVGGGAEPVISPTPDIVFAQVFDGVLKTNCLTCHRGFTDYAKVVANVPKLKAYIETGRMPMGSALPADQKDLLLNWISQGAPENAP